MCIYLYVYLFYVHIHVLIHVYEYVYLYIIFKACRKMEGSKSLDKIGEIMGTKRETKMLGLKEEKKANNDRLCKDCV